MLTFLVAVPGTLAWWLCEGRSRVVAKLGTPRRLAVVPRNRPSPLNNTLTCIGFE